MKKLSLIASAVLLSSSMAMADANSIQDAFTTGKVNGDVTVYTQSKNNKGANDNGYTTGSIGLNYETDSFNGFTASFGIRAQHELAERAEGDYEAAYLNNDAIMNVAAIKYATEAYFISVGRQEIDLEWLTDFNEAIVAGITSIPDTAIVLGYTDKKAEIGIDTVENFHEVSKKGAYVLDIKNTSIENVELNPYFYSAPDEADFYGLKVSYNNTVFGATAHYATTNQDSTSQIATNDGDIVNLEGRVNLAGIAFAGGYIKTDDHGIGSLNAYGDHISPFEDAADNHIYGSDAKTYYGSIGYEIAGVALSALYGETKYDNSGTKDKEAELNLIAGYSFTEELSAAVTYVDYNDKSTTNGDYDKILANITYAF